MPAAPALPPPAAQTALTAPVTRRLPYVVHVTPERTRFTLPDHAMTVPPPGSRDERTGIDLRSDADLVHAMAAGDEQAAAVLYDRTSAVLYGLALRVTGQAADADDVVVETFAQAWRDASRFDSGKASAIAWLTMMTRSRALDSVRARERRARATDSAANEPAHPVAMSQSPLPADIAMETAERAHAVTTALDTLPPPQRQAIELAFFEGLTHPEVADRLREPLGTVKTRIRLGMQKLRDALVGWAPEPGEGAS